MIYKQKTFPAAQVVTTEEAFKHLVLDITDDAGEIEIVNSLVLAATRYCESYQRRCYLLTEWEAYLNSWPSCVLMIEKSPVSSVTKIEYRDAGGVWQQLAADKYKVDAESEPALIAFNAGLPVVDRTAFNSIRIIFKSGYVDADGEEDTTRIPETVKAAIKLIVGHLYEHREQVVMGTIQAEMDFGVSALLDVDRVFVF
jgi:uncharacterized phiE125 gp8 family phage protein